MIKPQLRLVRLENKPILDQLKLEEALLRADKGNWCVFNHGSTPAIVLGISSKVEQHINTHKMQQQPVPIIRRFSGGGTVFVDPDTCFVTLICNEECTNIPCRTDAILQWNGALFADIAKDYKVKENDYTIGDRKFGGNAQYLTKKRWLHHSSLLWDYDMRNMEYLLFPPKTPDYRNARAHEEFLCRLKDSVKSKECIFDHVTERLKDIFRIEIVNESFLDAIIELPHRKATDILH